MSADTVVLWCVGQLIESKRRGCPKTWNLVGVFSTETEALKSCRTSEHFLGPAVLDVPFPEAEDWKGAYFPHR